MDRFEIKLNEINRILSRNNLGFIYDFKNDRDNGLVLPFFCMFMDSVKKFDLDFCITTNVNFQCGIIYDEKLIFMSYGTFDRLCKLSELIFRSGMITGKTKNLNFYDLHLVSNPFVGFNSEIREENESESHLFMFILECLMLFIISHEVGHFINKHGDRAIKQSFDNIFDDVLGHRKIDGSEIISSHARELVADGFALNIVKNHVQSAFDRQAPYLGNLLDFYTDEEGGVVFSLLLILCYFKLSDGLSPHEHFKSTHPSTAARVRFILSCHIESLNNEDETKMFGVYHNLIIIQLKSIFSSMGKDFELTWIKDTNTPEMTEWFNDVYKEHPNWIA
ncbi:hypothetical protein PCO86_20355 [Pectobacteriaceae bacterium CE70]|nr:hypothetical protein PCO86_20355 [Pectobacteriaceae bacterium CE70]WJY10571.1 hypothetical protein PCO80_20305 [Pectobacteriaceae bacterium C80]